MVPDDYHTKYVGKTENGEQFFLTTPFIAGGDEFVALFIWYRDGIFKEAIIDNLGPRTTMDEVERTRIFKKRLDDLGDYKLSVIDVEPFEIEKFNTKFGLFYKKVYFEDDEPYECIEFHPGDFISFYPPWEGDYDT